MKNKIILGLAIFSLIFLCGGLYIVLSIEKGTSALDNLIRLHQVEILREHLLIELKRVQVDLYFKNTRYARGAATMVSHVRTMDNTMNRCFSCHHSTTITIVLNELKDNVEQYKNAVSRILTIRANVQRLDEEEQSAFALGDIIMAKINNIIDIANKNLEQKTRTTLKTINVSKRILFLLIVLGPIFATIIASLFIRSLTRPVNVLLEATRRIKNVDLQYRIQEKLHDEFDELANAFNEMASSLEQQCTQMHRAEQLTVYGEMAAGLAHEIKTPLAGIKGAMTLFTKDENLSEEHRDVLGKVISEIKRIESLMKELLSYARPPKPKFISIDFNEILEKTTGLLSKYPSFSGEESKQIRIVKDFDKNLPLVETDPMQQQQVFLNLFLNAADAMTAGGVLTVKTRLNASDNLIEIYVSDTGTGIDEAIAKKLFIPFFTTKIKGTGLGLATSRRLVEQNGGSISFQSEQGKGTVFKILFPVKQDS